MTPDTVYRDQIQVVCGVDCVEDMGKSISSSRDGNYHSGNARFGFDISRAWYADETLGSQSYFKPVKVRQTYQPALKTVKRARKKVQKKGEKYIDYWIGRLEFGIGYLRFVKHQ